MAHTDIKEETKEHLSDMVALDEHVLEAVKRQLESEMVQADPDAQLLLLETSDILQRHVAQLTAMVELQDAETRGGLKSLLTSILGNVAGLYNQVRSEAASRAVRDTYTAINLVSAGLLAMKTFGLMVGKEQISGLAYQQMREILPLLMKFNHRLAYIVARETAETLKLPYDPAIPQRVENATQRIWRGED